MKIYTKNRKVHGVGINDADYNVTEREKVDGKRKIVWCCPYYTAWTNMLGRCYSKKVQSKQPTYKGCSVCEEWLTFSNFKKWMEKQDWQGKQLDKDLLVENNKTYSPDTCLFVDPKVNTFVTDRKASRGQYLIGASWDNNCKKFRSLCSNPFTGKKEYLGLFTNELEAHLAWKKRKHELACALADSEYCNDEKVAQVLRARYL